MVKSKLEKKRDEALKFLQTLKRAVDKRTYGALTTKIYQAITIRKIDDLFSKYHLKEIPNSFKNLKLGDLQNHNSKKKTTNLIEREYFIKAKVHFKETYTYMRRMGPRSVAYDKTKPIATTIRARTYKEAVEKFKDHAKEDVEQF